MIAVASLLCGIAPDAPSLIAARALQGVGGTLLMPGSLAILQASFTADDRGRAIRAWSGLGGVATAIGPFLGGWLVQAVSWRLIFYINLPITVAVVAIAARHVPESRDAAARGRVDFPGAMLVTVGLVGLTFGLIEGPALGWSSPAVLGALAGGVTVLAVFARHERRASNPMLPVDIFASGQFTAANAVTFIVYDAWRRPVPAPDPVAAGIRVHAVAGRRGPAPGHRDHACPVRPIRGTGRPHRAAVADEHRASPHRRWPLASARPAAT